jgi:4-amino-4-deoxychorismate lyase
MYPFFETIRYCNGVLENLPYHQQRVNSTFLHFNVEDILPLAAIPIQKSASFPSEHLGNAVYKCKIQYNLKGEYTIAFTPYSIRAIRSIEIVAIVNKQYNHKYTNRDWINHLHSNANADEIIMVENGIVKDASYANLCFFDGENWFTPQNPLLLGTRRAFLLDNGIIQEKEIRVQDLHRYQAVRLINAMMLWQESITLQLNK